MTAALSPCSVATFEVARRQVGQEGPEKRVASAERIHDDCALLGAVLPRGRHGADVELDHVVHAPLGHRHGRLQPESFDGVGEWVAALDSDGHEVVHACREDVNARED